MRLLLLLFVITFLTFESNAQPQEDQLIWDNKTRNFITFLPQDYDPDTQMPLVINMHPFLTNAQFQMPHTRFNLMADTAGIIVAYPSGINGRWNSGSFFGVPQPVDDVGFISALIDYMAILYNVDTRRVYLTGYSAGGFMSYRLACELTNRVAAIAPVAATMNEDLVPMCNPDRPVPVMAFNGTADAIVPFDGFLGTAPVQQVIDLWRDINGCDEVPVESMLPDISQADNTTTTRITYQNCDNDSELILDKINNGGHTWPGRFFPLLGNSSEDENANHEMWEFFQRHTIPDDLACDRPTGLTATFSNGNVILNWDEIENIEYYEVLYFLPGGPLQRTDPLFSNSLSLDFEGEGTILWTVSSKCQSDHISWAPVKADDIVGRFADDGRIAINTYPNPATNSITLEVKQPNTSSEVRIMDVMGNTVMQLSLVNEATRIDISGLNEGVYYVSSLDARFSSTSFRKH